MEFSADQQKVIDVRDKEILVSAAAGSGKTAVLVERILKIISEGDTDIDELLVVTFTNAAAAEMRERIRDAINEALEENPEDDNLKKQALLINHAHITTIDSFCKWLTDNHFEEAGIEPGFSVGDAAKVKMLLKTCIDDIMEEAYDKEKEYYEGFYEDWMLLTRAYQKKGRDDKVAELIEKLYGFLSSLPYPMDWLKEQEDKYTDEDGSFSEDKIHVLCKRLVKNEIEKYVRKYRYLEAVCTKPDGPGAYLDMLVTEREYYENILDIIDTDYEEAERLLKDRPEISTPRGDGDEKIRRRVSGDRRKIISDHNDLVSKYFGDSFKKGISDIAYTWRLIRPLFAATRALMDHFAEEKRSEKIIDFSDMEHMALKVLYNEDRTLSEVALQYREHFKQVMIDEYQDSNEVQETILTAISNKAGSEHPDLFMVGDVKQSIYKFRKARPELFIEKFNDFPQADDSDKVRIDLQLNFRSRKEVLDTVNTVFSPLMINEVGKVDYTPDVRLNYGNTDYIDHGDDRYESELLVFDKKDAEGNVSDMVSGEAEGRIIGMRIKELMAGTMVMDKKTKEERPLKYSDIAILLRKMDDNEAAIEEVLKNMGIPVISSAEKGYFSEREVEVLLDLLTVIDDPNNDLALASVLKSQLYSFTDDELAEISLYSRDNRKLSFYDRLCGSESEKAARFKEELLKYREKAKRYSVHDLLYGIVCEHEYDLIASAMPGGSIRRMNIEMLLAKAFDYEKDTSHGLYGFLRYMEQLKDYQIDLSGAAIEDEGSVKIMTIHKSKGLEFPVCFVSGLSGNFNKKDLTADLLLHQDEGVAVEYINPDERKRRKTFLYDHISSKIETDQIGEEIRVLYVALTRAREKLILTGVSSGYSDEIDKTADLCRDIIGKPFNERHVAASDILGCKTFLNMVMFADVLSKGEKAPFKTTVYFENDIAGALGAGEIEEILKKEDLMANIEASLSEEGDAIRERIETKYPHGEYEGLYTKTSVSELKHAAIDEDERINVVFETDKEEEVVPLFIRKEAKEEERVIGGARRGSAYHRLMEVLRFDDFDGISDINAVEDNVRAQAETIIAAGKMSKEDVYLVNFNKVAEFFLSKLGQDMIRADKGGKLKKEQPFVMNIPAKRLKEGFPEGETVLIQGIIDAYFETEDGIVLMDYKTDRVDKKEDLAARYQVQTDYYKEALTRITGKEVKEAYLYAFSFSESIAI